MAVLGDEPGTKRCLWPLAMLGADQAGIPRYACTPIAISWPGNYTSGQETAKFHPPGSGVGSEQPYTVDLLLMPLLVAPRKASVGSLVFVILQKPS